MNTSRKRFLSSLVVLAMVLIPLAVSAGNPQNDRPAAAGKPGKGQGHDMSQGKDKNHGQAAQGGNGGSHHGGGVHQAHGQGAEQHRHDREYWQRDWQADEFLAAGFNAAILAGLLGQDMTVLHTGARPLPPGIAKNLARGKPLPPGIAKQQPTGHLLSTLPRVQGHEWYAVGRDLILIQAGTLIVAEILREVFN
jgi:Ni/Co efflux regulator RcnB